METIERPTDTELAAEIGVSRGTFSSVQSGKRKLSKKTQERWDAIMGRYELAEAIEVAGQRETSALADAGRKLLSILGGRA